MTSFKVTVVKLALLVTATLGAVAGILTILEETGLPVMMRPLGSVNVKAAVAWLITRGGDGKVCSWYEKVTGTALPGATDPSGIPVTGDAPGRETELTVTLPGTKTVPAGVLSVKVA
ncbi:hypothetical protein D3C75_712220 [compost metagenome]